MLALCGQAFTPGKMMRPTDGSQQQFGFVMTRDLSQGTEPNKYKEAILIDKSSLPKINTCAFSQTIKSKESPALFVQAMIDQYSGVSEDVYVLMLNPSKLTEIWFSAKFSFLTQASVDILTPGPQHYSSLNTIAENKIAYATLFKSSKEKFEFAISTFDFSTNSFQVSMGQFDPTGSSTELFGYPMAVIQDGPGTRFFTAFTYQSKDNNYVKYCIKRFQPSSALINGDILSNFNAETKFQCDKESSPPTGGYKHIVAMAKYSVDTRLFAIKGTYQDAANSNADVNSNQIQILIDKGPNLFQLAKVTIQLPEVQKLIPRMTYAHSDGETFYSSFIYFQDGDAYKQVYRVLKTRIKFKISNIFYLFDTVTTSIIDFDDACKRGEVCGILGSGAIIQNGNPSTILYTGITPTLRYKSVPSGGSSGFVMSFLGGVSVEQFDKQKSDLALTSNPIGSAIFDSKITIDSEDSKVTWQANSQFPQQATTFTHLKSITDFSPLKIDYSTTCPSDVSTEIQGLDNYGLGSRAYFIKQGTTSSKIVASSDDQYGLQILSGTAYTPVGCYEWNKGCQTQLSFKMNDQHSIELSVSPATTLDQVPSQTSSGLMANLKCIKCQYYKELDETYHQCSLDETIRIINRCDASLFKDAKLNLEFSNINQINEQTFEVQEQKKTIELDAIKIFGDQQENNKYFCLIWKYELIALSTLPDGLVQFKSNEELKNAKCIRTYIGWDTKTIAADCFTIKINLAIPNDLKFKLKVTLMDGTTAESSVLNFKILKCSDKILDKSLCKELVSEYQDPTEIDHSEKVKELGINFPPVFSPIPPVKVELESNQAKIPLPKIFDNEGDDYELIFKSDDDKIIKLEKNPYTLIIDRGNSTKEKVSVTYILKDARGQSQYQTEYIFPKDEDEDKNRNSTESASGNATANVTGNGTANETVPDNSTNETVSQANIKGENKPQPVQIEEIKPVDKKPEAKVVSAPPSGPKFVFDPKVFQAPQIKTVYIPPPPVKSVEALLMERDEEKLSASIEDIDTLGLVTIKFNRKLDSSFKTPKDIENFLFLEIEIGDYELPPNFNKSKFDFLWGVTEFDAEESIVKAQMNFTDAIYVSAQDDQDILKVSIRGMPQTNKRGLKESKQINCSSSISRQMPNTEGTKQYDGVTTQVETGMAWTTLVLFALTAVFSNAATKIFGAILSLQVVIHLGLLNFNMPGNSLNFLKKLKPIVSFNLIKKLATLTFKFFPADSFLQIELRKTIQTQFQDMGIKTFNCIEIMANLFYVELYIMSIVSLLVIVKLFMICGNRCLTGKSKELYEKYKKKIFFSYILEFCCKGFIPMVIATFMSFQFSLRTTFGEELAFNNACIVSLLIYVFYPTVMIYCIYVSKETLEIPEFKQKYGVLWGNVKTENRWQRAFRFIFILRRFLVLFASYQFRGQPIFQIQLIAFCNLFYLIYTGLASPFKTNFANKMDLFNESMVIILTNHMYLFTDFILDIELQEALGWSMVFFIVVYLLVNGYFVTKDMFKNFKQLIVQKFQKCCKKKDNFSKVQTTGKSSESSESSEEEESPAPPIKKKWTKLQTISEESIEEQLDDKEIELKKQALGEILDAHFEKQVREIHKLWMANDEFDKIILKELAKMEAREERLMNAREADEM